MNNPLVQLVLMSVATGFLLNHCAKILIGHVDLFFKKRMFPSVRKAKSKDLCQYHSWNQIYLAMMNIEPASYKVCTDCGLVFGTNKCLNKAGLEVYKLKREQMELQNQITIKALKIRQIKLDEAMNNLIKTCFIVCNPNVPMQQNIEFMQNFFRKAVIEIDNVNHDLNEAINNDSNQSKLS